MSQDLRQEGRQIVRMVVNMIVARRMGGDMDRPHPHRVGRCQVAQVILEHRALIGGKTIKRKDCLECCLFRFGEEVRVFDPVDRVKDAGQPPGLQHPVGIGAARSSIPTAVGPMRNG